MTGLRNVRNSWRLSKLFLVVGLQDKVKTIIDEGQGSQKGQKKRRVEMPFEGVNKRKIYKWVICFVNLCNMIFKTTKSCA